MVRSRNGWLSPILSSSSIGFGDHKTSVITVPSLEGRIYKVSLNSIQVFIFELEALTCVLIAVNLIG
jgi:hypothetical protein